MTNIVRKNKTLREFTFVLVSITLIGILVCFLVKDEYCVNFQVWFKRQYKRIKKLYDELNDKQKEKLYDLATHGAHYVSDVAVDFLSKEGFSKEHTKLIISLGSKVVEKTLTTIDKKLSDEKKTK